MNEGSQLPPFKQLARVVDILVLGANSLGALLTFFFLSSIAPLPVGESPVEAVAARDLISTIIGIVVLLLLGGFIGKRAERYFPDWYERLRMGQAPETMPDAVQREVLNYPFAVAATSFAMWFLAGIFFGLLIGKSFRSFVAIAFVGGVFTSVLAFFAVDLYWRRIIPVFFPQGGVSAVRSWHLSVFARLLIVFLLSSVYPLGLILMLSFDRARRIPSASNPEVIIQNMFLVEIFLFLISLGSSTLMAFFASRTVIGPLEKLQSAMVQVQRNDFSARTPVLSNDEVGYLAERFNDMVAGLRRGELMRNLLNLYVSPEVAREALEHGASLGGQLVECTVLFSDIRSFTTLSERLDPADLIALLNRYMSDMVDVIVSHGGMVNKFGGDSLLAVFGTPLNPLSNHASAAVDAALGMRRALVEFNKVQSASGKSQLQCGIAVATGKVVAGNVGGRERIEYTVIGDTVNLAARLQSMSKELHHDILLNEDVYLQANLEKNLDAVKIPNVTVRGKSEPVTVYAL